MAHRERLQETSDYIASSIGITSSTVFLTKEVSDSQNLIYVKEHCDPLAVSKFYLN